MRPSVDSVQGGRERVVAGVAGIEILARAAGAAVSGRFAGEAHSHQKAWVSCFVQYQQNLSYLFLWPSPMESVAGIQ